MLCVIPKHWRILTNPVLPDHACLVILTFGPHSLTLLLDSSYSHYEDVQICWVDLRYNERECTENFHLFRPNKTIWAVKHLTLHMIEFSQRRGFPLNFSSSFYASCFVNSSYVRIIFVNDGSLSLLSPSQMSSCETSSAAKHSRQKYLGDHENKRG